MRAVLQRVTDASVTVEGRVVGRIGLGLLVFLGVAKGDGETDCRTLAEKVWTFRIFSDDRGKMNRSLADVGGAVLLVSQFTLLGNAGSGRRPSFEDAASPEDAKRLYERTVELLRGQVATVETGIFAAHMTVQLVNDGPVTFILESR